MRSQQLGIFGSVIAPEVDVRILEVSHDGDPRGKRHVIPLVKGHIGRYEAVHHNGTFPPR